MTKKKAIIVDLDNCLCDIEHRVHYMRQTPKNCQAFYDGLVDDHPNTAIRYIVDRVMADDEDIRVLFVTGRPDSHRIQTMQWLQRHCAYEVYWLFMRATGDHRKDEVVKEEIYHESIEPYYDVMFVLEDRTSVVNMWRSLGLTCLQVAPGDF